MNFACANVSFRHLSPVNPRRVNSYGPNSGNPNCKVLSKGLSLRHFDMIGNSTMPIRQNDIICPNANLLNGEKCVRVPDIQMINKYYGLVPKKFAIHVRPPNEHNSSKLSTKLRAKSAHSFDSQRPFVVLDMNRMNDRKSSLHVHSSKLDIRNNNALSNVHGNNGRHKTPGQVELVARRMSMEKASRWRKQRSQSLNIESSECLIPELPQRVIRIDLNNMSWEETFPTCEDGEGETEKIVKQLGMYTCKTGNRDSPDRLMNTIPNGTGTSANLQNLNNEALSSGSRRGVLRKTSSFDDQLLKPAKLDSPGASAPACENAEKKAGKRPATAAPPRVILPSKPIIGSQVQNNNLTGNINNGNGNSMIQPGGTGKPSIGERRGRFQRSASLQETLDYDDFDDKELSGKVATFAKENFNESRQGRKSLHVRPPPEMVTMVSRISPPVDLELELEKVAVSLQSSFEDDDEIGKGVSPEPDKENVITPVTNNPEVDGTVAQCRVEESPDPSSSPGSSTLCQPQLNSIMKNHETPTRARPPLRKAVSISCEKELSNPPAQVSHVNKSPPRPKTAAGNKSGHRLFRSSSTNISDNKETRSSSSPSSTSSLSPENPSSGLKNRKILIKKALMEINHGSVAIGKKWGILGRPKTAPTEQRRVAFALPSTHLQGQGASSITKASLSTSNQRHPIKPNVRSQGSNKSPGMSNKTFTSLKKMEAQTTQVKEIPNQSKTGSQGLNANQPESSDEPGTDDSGGPPRPGLRGMLHRQSFSLDEGLLLGFQEAKDTPEVSRDTEVSFLNSKKREECLKVYEKMMKTGCNVKLDTIFRGMMTPSEYRTFVQSQDKASSIDDAKDKTLVDVDRVDTTVQDESQEPTIDSVAGSAGASIVQQQAITITSN